MRIVRSLAVLATGLGLWGASAPPAAAQGQIPCGDFYEVSTGDTLREIALAAYGVGSYQLIYNANQDILRSPSLLLVGQRLFIPCLDGSGPATRQEAAAIQSPEIALQTGVQPALQGAEPRAQSGGQSDGGAQAIQPSVEGSGQGAAQASAGGLQPVLPPAGGGNGGAEAGAQPVLPPANGGGSQTGADAGGQSDAQPVQPVPAAPEPSGGGIAPRLVAQGGSLPTQELPAPVQPLPQLLPSGEPQDNPAIGVAAALQGGGTATGSRQALIPLQTGDPALSATDGSALLNPPVQGSNVESASASGTAASGAVLNPPVQTGDAELAAVDDGFDETDAAGVDRTMRFLTGSNFAPFTDEDLPQGGMITEIVRNVLEKSAAGRDYRITFVNDWAAHLNVLLPDGAFDLGFPWYRPDCSQAEKLSEGMRARCTDFYFSRPLYEVVVGYYVRNDDPLVGTLDPTEMFGRTICRPRGYFTFDLETADLVEPNVTFRSPDSPADCFTLLQSGAVDVVTLNILLAEEEITRQGLDGLVVELPDLATIQTLHILAPKTSPYGRTYLALLNKGIRQVRESGEWFEIVSRHLAEHAARTAAAQ